MKFAADGAATDSTAHELRRAQAAIEHELEQLTHTAAGEADRAATALWQ